MVQNHACTIQESRDAWRHVEPRKWCGRALELGDAYVQHVMANMEFIQTARLYLTPIHVRQCGKEAHNDGANETTPTGKELRLMAWQSHSQFVLMQVRYSYHPSSSAYYISPSPQDPVGLETAV